MELDTILVVGVGNPFRRDDGVGPWIAERLGQLRQDLRVVQARADASALVTLLHAGENVLFVDATRSGQSAGTLIHLDAHHDDLSALNPATSTHALGLAEAIGLARALDRMPRRLHIVGVEAGDVSMGEGLSPQVKKAAQRLVNELSQDPRGVFQEIKNA